jgi:hypothetical protein
MWWHYDTNITTGSTIVLPISFTGSTYNMGAGLNVAKTRGFNYLSFMFKGSQVMTLEIQTANQTAGLTTWISFAGAAVVWNTTYDLPAPYTNSTGRLVLTAIYTRLRIINVSGATSLNVQINARAWRE